MLLPVLSSILALAPAALAVPTSWWTVPGATGDGFESVSNAFYIDASSSHVTGYYQASQWWFKGHDVLYFGLQPYGPERPTTGHLTYSVFGPGSSIGDPSRCTQGADSGSGVSCSLDINFDYGRWYKIEATVVEKKTDGSRRWNGTFIDDQGTRTYIASFWTDSTYGALKGDLSQWLEYYPYNGGVQRCLPYFKCQHGLPEAVGGGSAYHTQITANEIDQHDPCAVAAGKSNWDSSIGTDGEFHVTVGFLS